MYISYQLRVERPNFDFANSKFEKNSNILAREKSAEIFIYFIMTLHNFLSNILSLFKSN